MLLHVSVCDHHQGARIGAWLKVQLSKMFGKNTSLWTCSGVAAYCVTSIVMCMLCAVQDETELIQYAATPLRVHNDVFLTNIFEN